MGTGVHLSWLRPVQVTLLLRFSLGGPSVEPVIRSFPGRLRTPAWLVGSVIAFAKFLCSVGSW